LATSSRHFPAGCLTNIYLSELPNPTWVLDLGWIIPTALAAAWMLRRRRPAGPVIAGAMLVMLLILSVTMLAVVPFALAAGLDTDPVVHQQLIVFTILFTSARRCRDLVAGSRRTPT